jgi:hypothetical protein
LQAEKTSTRLGMTQRWEKSPILYIKFRFTPMCFVLLDNGFLVCVFFFFFWQYSLWVNYGSILTLSRGKNRNILNFGSKLIPQANYGTRPILICISKSTRNAFCRTCLFELKSVFERIKCHFLSIKLKSFDWMY